MPSTVKQTVTALESALAELTARAQRQSEQLERVTARAEQLEQRLARGTGDVTMAAEAATEWGFDVPTRIEPRPAGATPDLTTALHEALRRAPMSASDAALALNVPVGHVTIALRALRRAHRVVNVGTAEAPRWLWCIGADCSTADLMVEIERLLKMPRAWTLQELVEATGGVNHNRISGVRVRLQQAGLTVRNLGNAHRGRWTANPKAR